MSTAVFRLLTACREAFVSIGLCGYVVGIVSYIGDQRLDIFDIGAIGQVSDRCGLFLVVDIYLQDAFFMGHVFFDTTLTFLTLNGRGLDDGCQLLFGLCKGSAGKADQQEKKDLYFLHM